MKTGIYKSILNRLQYFAIFFFFFFFFGGGGGGGGEVGGVEVVKLPPDLTYHISTTRVPVTYNLINSSLLMRITLNSALKYINFIDFGAYKSRINEQNHRKFQTFEEIRF